MLCGVTDLAVTKTDVLSDFERIGVGTHYRYDNKVTRELPYDLQYEDLSVEYEYHDGWMKDISAVRSYGELPAAAQAYVEMLENQIGVPVSFVSNGPEREALIVKEAEVSV